ncbi:2-oxoglutarate oxidoreductase subunit KorA [Streptomyces tanashiensis]
MNPAALKANIGDVPRGGEIIVNTDEFAKRADGRRSGTRPHPWRTGRSTATGSTRYR